jgi:hypothetical protein
MAAERAGAAACASSMIIGHRSGTNEGQKGCKRRETLRTSAQVRAPFCPVQDEPHPSSGLGVQVPSAPQSSASDQVFCPIHDHRAQVSMIMFPRGALEDRADHARRRSRFGHQCTYVSKVIRSVLCRSRRCTSCGSAWLVIRVVAKKWRSAWKVPCSLGQPAASRQPAHSRDHLTWLKLVRIFGTAVDDGEGAAEVVG